MIRKLLAMTLAAAAFVLASPAWALDCDSMFVDDTGRVTNPGVVSVAGNQLAAAGAEVRVRVIKNSRDYNGLDNYVAGMTSRCRSWQASDGGRRNNLVAIVVSMDRQSGIYAGGQFSRAVTRSVSDETRNTQMNPRFRDGDFGGGIAAGLNRTREIIVAANAPPTPAERTAPPQAPIIINNGPPAQPADLSGLWTVMKWGLGLLALIGLGVVVFRIRASRARSRAAQQKAQTARSSCANRITELDDPISLCGARLDKLTKSVAEGDTAGLRERFGAMQQSCSAASAQYSDLQSSSNNPDKPGLSEAEYEGMEEAFNAVLRQLDSVRRERESLEADVKSLQTQVDQAKPSLDALQGTLEQAATDISAVGEQGFKTDEAEAVLAEAIQLAEQADAAFKGRRIAKVKGICTSATAKAAAAVAAAQDLAARKVRIDSAIVALDGRIPNVKATIQAAKGVFDDIAATYAESSWDTVRGNGTEAVRRVNLALGASKEAATAATMESQDWQRAETILGNANTALDEAEGLMRSITALQDNLAAAKRDAAAEVDHAQRDLAEAKAYETLYDDDITDDVKEPLRNAQATIDSAKSLLDEAKPDYLRVLKLAKEVHAAVDKIFAICKGERENAERRRQRAVSSVRDANAAISRAKEYIEDHKSDVGISAGSHLEDANTRLSLAERTDNLDSKIQLAEEAESKADTALSKAQADVSKAEKARRARRRQQHSSGGYGGGSSGSGDFVTGVLVGSVLSDSHHHHDSGSSGSSGGWGSSSSDGGSSSSGGWGSDSGSSSSSDWGSSSDSGSSSDWGGSSGGSDSSGGW